jgi:membrane fusion protein (multidrug efflux system)
LSVVGAIFRGLWRVLSWPFRALWRFVKNVFRRRGPVVGTASVVGVICAFLLLWNYAIAPGLMILHFMKMGKPQVTVEAVQVRTVTWTPGIEAVGSARAIRGADLATEVDGVVTAVNFAPQAQVAAGQQLTQIDDAVERADLIGGQANVNMQQSAQARAIELGRKGVNSQSQLDDARNKLDLARSQLAHTMALIDQKALKAPFAGTVGIPRVDVGQYVTKGTVLVTLQDLDQVYVDFTVPEQMGSQISQGQPVHVGLNGNDLAYNGTIVGTDPKIDPKTRLINVRAQVDDAHGRILPGQFLRVRIDLPAESNVVAVPATAVVPSLYGDFVYLIAPPESADKDGKTSAPQVGPLKSGTAKQVIVELGRRNGALVEIRKGVSVGQLLVNGGQNKLQSGASVVIADPPPAGKVASAGGAP